MDLFIYILMGLWIAGTHVLDTSSSISRCLYSLKWGRKMGPRLLEFEETKQRSRFQMITSLDITVGTKQS